MRRSIRWELPLSYAIIALVATVALGAALLLFLRSHYGRVERQALEGNALAFSYALAPLLQEDTPAESMRAQVTSLSFLSRARVRLLDSDGSVLADSRSPRRFAVAVAARPEGDAPLQAGETMTETRSLIAIEPLLESGLVVTRTQPIPPGLRSVLPWRADPLGYVRFRLERLGDGRYPLLVGGDDEASRTPSGITVQQPVYSDSGDLLGYVELSEGPAYGQEIVANVALCLLLAAALAVALAAAAGWLVSRRITTPLLALSTVTASMAEGDLAARADATHRDEFGILARSFNAMADRVEDTVVTLRRFVSDAAHELNTPLATLRANLEMMQRGSEPGTGDAQPGDERMARAQAQVERLEVLTQGMLDLSRIESGASRGERKPVALADLARECGELYASRAEQAELDFELALPETAVTVCGDGAQLRRALGNLLDNAIKFTQPGGRVCLALEQDGEWAVLRVVDTGIGIPPEDLPHLFQRFHRGRNAGGYAGSGLGLAIVQAIATGHGGEVTAESSEQGTVLCLRLPVA